MKISDQQVMLIRKYLQRLAPKLGILGEDIKDLEQEVLLRLCLHFNDSNGSKTNIKLLYDIARKRAIDVVRSWSKVKQHECQFLKNTLETSDDKFEDRIVNYIYMNQQIDKMKSADQKIVRYEQMGFTDAEKALNLGVTLSTIWWQKNQLRKNHLGGSCRNLCCT